MRRLLLTATLIALLTLPLFAQRGGRGGRGGPGMMMFGPNSLLMNKGVQDEIKLTAKQKQELEAILKTSREAGKKAREEAQGDREKMAEAFKKVTEDRDSALKKFRAGLTKVQDKRFGQIELQQEGPKAFTKEKVQADLKLTDKQKDEINEIVKECETDVGDLLKTAFAGRGGGPRGGGDRKKREEARKKMEQTWAKVGKFRKDATDKIFKSLDDNQKKVWKDMTGATYTVKREAFGGGRGGRRPKDKADKKED
jgi:Spy/CpxP family protein refolding chaperone